MKLYRCTECDNLLYFENSSCLICGNGVGFDAQLLTMKTVSQQQDGTWSNPKGNGQSFRFCLNAEHGACNWLIPAQLSDLYCTACSLNQTIPDLSVPENRQRWTRIENAKHRLVYSLLRLGLPVYPKTDEKNGIAFEFLENTEAEQKVLTGHDDGVITLNIEEADEGKRVKNKVELGEKYRTLLGHFRHEIGHYYWDVFFKYGERNLDSLRETFGDERIDYNKALEQYYQLGAGAAWSEQFISPYATAHPWEDWAETWSHYLHMMDTLETAYAFGMGIHPIVAKKEALNADIWQDPYAVNDFDRIVQLWLPLTFAVNSLNRSMGHPDFYPFVIAPRVISKLTFIHRQIRSFVGARSTVLQD